MGQQVGRYVILEELGKGGMGVVYKAYDPELGRALAVKLLTVAREGNVGGEACSRLLREAQALAQIAHPNVIAVYDAGTHGGEVFVAMELVEGETLDRWLSTRQRSRAEILGVMSAAGRGLAAAHAAGLVHRDFKPRNVMVGKDGRVRVLDFGLARAAHGEAAEHLTDAMKSAIANLDETLASISTLSSSQRLLTAPVTRAGVLLGTPAYIAPEQYVTAEVDARADQWAFTVTLFEALVGRKPFPAKRLEHLVRNAMLGDVEWPSGHGIPEYLVQIIERGLLPAPEERYGSMDELLAELANDPEQLRLQRRTARRRALMIGTCGGLIGALLLATWNTIATRDLVCSGASQHLTGVWDTERRAALERAFLATDKPFAAAAWERVETGLGRYAAHWAEQYTEACRATRIREEQSEGMLDMRMQCLYGRLKEMRALVNLFASADANVVTRAVLALHNLGELAVCGDLERLSLHGNLPRDEATRQAADELQSSLAEIKALDQMARYQKAFELARDAATRAQTLSHPPVLARARYWLARQQEHLGNYDDAQQTLEQAILDATASGDRELEVRFSNYMTTLAGNRLERYTVAERVAPRARAIITSLGDNKELLADWLVAEGAVLWSRGDYSAAKDSLQRALALQDELLAPQDLRRTVTLNKLGSACMFQSQHKEGLHYYQQALAVTETALGPNHPDVAKTMSNVANAYESLGKTRAAQEKYEQALAVLERALGSEHPDVATILYNLGRVYTSNGLFEQALQNYTQCEELWTRAYGAKHPRIAYVKNVQGIVARRTGDLAQAKQLYQQALQIRESALDTEHPAVGESLYNLALVAVKMGDSRRARSHLQRALAIFKKAHGPMHDSVAQMLSGWAMTELADEQFPQAIATAERSLAICKQAECEPSLVAETQFVLAKALWPVGGSRNRAVRLAQQAHRYYASAAGEPETRAELAAWMKARGIASSPIEQP